MKFITKRGQIRNFKQIDGDIVIKSTDLNKFNQGIDAFPLFYIHNNCAILLGVMRKEFLEQISLEQILNRVEIYNNNLKLSLKKESLNGSHELYTSSFEYVEKLLNATLEEFESFKSFYENHLDEKRKENERKEKERIEKERQDEILRVNKIKENIINDVPISGNELLQLINILDFNCPIRTKGLINKCKKLNTSKFFIDGKAPQQKSINNVFKWYRIVRNYLIENAEYDKLNHKEREEIENLFN